MSDLAGLTVADVMLAEPKTLSGSASVGEVRAMLENPSVQMVLLADDGRFRGSVTAIPAGASDQDPAVQFADPSPRSLAAGEPAQTAFDVTSAEPHRRAVVLGDDGRLLGLVCLNQARTHFCGKS
ncbi:MAG TPA: CBS domain-containing protein [Gaiellaceae bacterium]|nr:CBS domain-containing protein [Gaiellaceae bacterium]